jgi:hypothetical protein
VLIICGTWTSRRASLPMGAITQHMHDFAKVVLFVQFLCLTSLLSLRRKESRDAAMVNDTASEKSIASFDSASLQRNIDACGTSSKIVFSSEYSDSDATTSRKRGTAQRQTETSEASSWYSDSPDDVDSDPPKKKQRAVKKVKVTAPPKALRKAAGTKKPVVKNPVGRPKTKVAPVVFLDADGAREGIYIDRYGNSTNRQKSTCKPEPFKVKKMPQGGWLGDVKEVSVTISVRGGDIDAPDALDRMQLFLDYRCIKGLFGQEQGEQEDNTHLQGVIKVVTSSAQALNLEIKHALGWCGKNGPKGGVVMCQYLRYNNPMHTFTGMLGYCTKDATSHPSSFRVIIKNISDKELKEGDQIYLKHGRDALKDRLELLPKNLLGKAALYFKFKLRNDVPDADLEDIIFHMIKSGLYYPGPAWVIPTAGNGMASYRIKSAWKAYMEPESIEIADVLNIFFAPGSDKPPLLSETYMAKRGRYFDAGAHANDLRAQMSAFVGEMSTDEFVAVKKTLRKQQDSDMSGLRLTKSLCGTRIRVPIDQASPSLPKGSFFSRSMDDIPLSDPSSNDDVEEAAPASRDSASPGLRACDLAMGYTTYAGKGKAKD